MDMRNELPQNSNPRHFSGVSHCYAHLLANSLEQARAAMICWQIGARESAGILLQFCP
jgi:hypothetical protein